MTHENSSGTAYTCLTTTTTYIALSITQVLYKLAQEHWAQQAVSENKELAVPKFPNRFYEVPYTWHSINQRLKSIRYLA